MPYNTNGLPPPSPSTYIQPMLMPSLVLVCLTSISTGLGLLRLLIQPCLLSSPLLRVDGILQVLCLFPHAICAGSSKVTLDTPLTRTRYSREYIKV